MKILSKHWGIGLALLLCFSSINSKADVKKRWELEFTHKSPRLFTYVDPLGNRTNYSYIIYTITNPTEENINLSLDLCIKTDKDKYYQDSIHPLVEDEIIIKEERLGGLSLGIRKERIKELKQELKYLNCKEVRDKGEIKPKETIIGIAIFIKIDPRSKEFDMMVGGLVDVVKHRYERELEGNLEDKLVFEYECKVLKITYQSSGDEFYSPFKDIQKTKKEWIVRNYGPIGNKDSLPLLIQSLEHENPTIRWVAWWLLRRLTDQQFGYQPEQDAEKNPKAILRWKEWYAVNKDRLVYNLLLNKFEIKEKRD